MGHSIAQFFYDARTAIGFTRTDVTKKISFLTEAALKQYESGKVIPNLTTAYLLCDLYDVDWNELWEKLEQHIFDAKEFEYGKPFARDGFLAEAAPRHIALGRPGIAHQRQRNGFLGEQIVTRRLKERGFSVLNMNDIQVNHPNYDLEATRDGRMIRVEVKAKKHESKANLCVSWDEDRPSFNRSGRVEPADILVMVRFTDEDDECFVLPIKDAEEKADWFAQQLIDLGNVPQHMYPYVSKRPRTTRFAFNTREVWEPYSEAWELLGS